MTAPPLPTTEVRPPPNRGARRALGEMWHRAFGPLRPPTWLQVTRVLMVAIGVAAICWFFGADAWHSILLGSVVTTVGLVISSRGTLSERGDTEWRDERRARAGARNDVAQLSWSLRPSFGRVSNTALWRVQQLARRRLALHQLDIREPAQRRQIEQLIGRRAYALLVSDGRRPPHLRSLLHSLDALDGLGAIDPTQRTPLASRPRRWTSILTPDLPRRARAR